MVSNYKIIWTDEAISNLKSALSYLNNSWTERETENFKISLTRLLRIIQQNPYLFPVSAYNSRLRKAVLRKETIIFYEISGDIFT